jgi:FixJ family two-component response regulator
MTRTNRQTVFVVDDDAAVRDSIAELADSVGLDAECYASAREFLDAFRAERPGCLVLDVRMAAMSGLALQERLNEMTITIPVIVITGHGDVPMAVQAMRNGAIDFIQKPYRDQALLDSINTALAQNRKARHPDAEQDKFDRLLATLTEREHEVLEHLKKGKTSKQIASALEISPRTAEVHRRNLLHQLGIGSARELILRLASWTQES